MIFLSFSFICLPFHFGTCETEGCPWFNYLCKPDKFYHVFLLFVCYLHVPSCITWTCRFSQARKSCVISFTLEGNEGDRDSCRTLNYTAWKQLHSFPFALQWEACIYIIDTLHFFSYDSMKRINQEIMTENTADPLLHVLVPRTCKTKHREKRDVKCAESEANRKCEEE